MVKARYDIHGRPQVDLSDNGLDQRLHKFRTKKKEFHSGRVFFSQDDRRNALRWLHRTFLVVWIHYMIDCLKAATNFPSRPAKSAFFTQATTNCYMGYNKKVRNNNDGATEVVRVAYATGTGGSTIGLDARKLRINPMPPPLWKLIDLVVDTVKKANKYWAELLAKYPPNAASTKLAHSYTDEKGKVQWKFTGSHCDTLYTADNVPYDNNSQEPNSLVMMVTFGDPKELWFKKHYNASNIVPNSEIRFNLTHGSIVVLDPRDEMWHESEHGRWKWQHSSNMTEERNITFSLMIRTCKAVATVTPAGNLANPTNTENRSKRFKKAARLMTTKWYKTQLDELESRMRDFFKRYDPK